MCFHLKLYLNTNWTEKHVKLVFQIMSCVWTSLPHLRFSHYNIACSTYIGKKIYQLCQDVAIQVWPIIVIILFSVFMIRFVSVTIMYRKVEFNSRQAYSVWCFIKYVLVSYPQALCAVTKHSPRSNFACPHLFSNPFWYELQTDKFAANKYGQGSGAILWHFFYTILSMCDVQVLN